MLPDLAERPPAGLPAATRQHLAECPACHRALAAARVTRGAIAALAETPEPPAEFAARVLRALPIARIVAPADPWRPAWMFLPAFAVVVAALFLLPAPILESDPAGLLSLSDLSDSEQMVFGGAALSPDLVLAAVLEGGAP
jgi:anti-sigma factor RsiW